LSAPDSEGHEGAYARAAETMGDEQAYERTVNNEGRRAGVRDKAGRGGVGSQDSANAVARVGLSRPLSDKRRRQRRRLRLGRPGRIEGRARRKPW